MRDWRPFNFVMKRQGALYQHRDVSTKRNCDVHNIEKTSDAPTATERALNPEAHDFTPVGARELAPGEKDWLARMQHWISAYETSGKIACRRCGQPGHLAAECSAPKTCNQCGRRGHLRYSRQRAASVSHSCPLLRSAAKNALTNPSRKGATPVALKACPPRQERRTRPAPPCHLTVCAVWLFGRSPCSRLPTKAPSNPPAALAADPAAVPRASALSSVDRKKVLPSPKS